MGLWADVAVLDCSNAIFDCAPPLLEHSFLVRTHWDLEPPCCRKKQWTEFVTDTLATGHQGIEYLEPGIQISAKALITFEGQQRFQDTSRVQKIFIIGT